VQLSIKEGCRLPEHAVLPRDNPARYNVQSMRSVPVTILCGSDRKPGSMPETGIALHPLATYKGVAIEIEGRPLIAHLVERINASEAFGPVTLAGPERIFGPLGLEAELVDTDGTVSENLHAALQAHESTGEGPLAILACDVLLETSELDELRRGFEADRPCALWFPLVRMPDDPDALGAFGWKPTYKVLPEPDADPVPVLPGHLCLFDPEQLRLPLLYKLMDGAYRTRNRSVRYRRAVMVRMVLFSLIAQDLKLLSVLRAPTRTVQVLLSGLRFARALRSGGILQGEPERLVGNIFLRTNVDHAHGMRFPITDVVSLAEDIDTQEEAAQFGAEMRSRTGESSS
jgi:hypothetical protein